MMCRAALPNGIDAAIEQCFIRTRADRPVNTLCALAAETPRDGRRRGLALELLGAMRAIACSTVIDTEPASGHGDERMPEPTRRSNFNLGR